MHKSLISLATVAAFVLVLDVPEWRSQLSLTPSFQLTKTTTGSGIVYRSHVLDHAEPIGGAAAPARLVWRQENPISRNTARKRDADDSFAGIRNRR